MEFYINDAKSESAIKVSLKYVCKIYLHGSCNTKNNKHYFYELYICEYDEGCTFLDLVFADYIQNFWNFLGSLTVDINCLASLKSLIHLKNIYL